MLLISLVGMVGCSTAEAEMLSEPRNSEMRAGQYFLGDILGNTIGGGSITFSTPMSNTPAVILTVRSSNTVSSKFWVWVGEVSSTGFTFSYLTEPDYSLKDVYIQWIAVIE
jgi:hypothetical protein